EEAVERHVLECRHVSHVPHSTKGLLPRVFLFGGPLSLPGPCGAVYFLGFDCHNPITAPVGSVKMLSQPMSMTSVTSLRIFAPRDFAFFVAARMSSTPT